MSTGVTSQAFEAAVQTTSPELDQAIEDSKSAKFRAEELVRVVTELLEMK